MESYFKMLVSILLVYISIINLNCTKLKIKKVILAICLTEFLGILLILLNFGQFVTLIPVIAISCVLLYKNNNNIVFSIIKPLISLMILVASDNLISYAFFTIYKENSDMINKNIKVYIQFNIAMLILAFIISKLVGILLNKKLKIANLELKRRPAALIVLSVILTFTIFYVNIILENGTISNSEMMSINAISFAAYFVLLMIIMYILIRSITKDLEIKNKQLQFENLQEYTTNLETLYTDMRAFRHDYINIISSLVGYIENKDMDGLEKHFNANIVPLSKGIESNNFKLGLLKNIKLPELKGIVCSKVIRAQELGIDVFIDIAEPIEKIDMNVIDLCRVVGILIDNAVEAALNCDKPSLKIGFVNKKNSVIIVVINSYSGDIPPLSKIFQKGFSTKGENRGLGLSNLKEIINNCKNVSLDTAIETEGFIQNIEISHKLK
jgi:two-component system sensor histidine kinase AgrC